MHSLHLSFFFTVFLISSTSFAFSTKISPYSTTPTPAAESKPENGSAARNSGGWTARSQTSTTPRHGRALNSNAGLVEIDLTDEIQEQLTENTYQDSTQLYVRKNIQKLNQVDTARYEQHAKARDQEGYGSLSLKDGIWIIQFLPQENDAKHPRAQITPNGTYQVVILTDGRKITDYVEKAPSKIIKELVPASPKSIRHSHHSSIIASPAGNEQIVLRLTLNQPVHFAGQIEFKKGKISAWNLITNDYKCHIGNHKDNFRKQAIQTYGLPEDKYVENLL